MDQDYLELKSWLEETRDEPLEEMAGFFDARIEGYEEHMACWQAHYKWMAEFIPEQAEQLLDLGCGSGLELDCIFSRFPDLSVTGVDLSAEMLDKLKSKYPDKKMKLVQADYFEYDLGVGCFDVVVSFETLHHFTAEKKAELFGRIYRSLKPGGIYLECDYIAVSQEIEDITFAECRRKRERDRIPDAVFVHFDTPLTLQHELEAIRAGGFEQVEVIGFLPGDHHTPLIRAAKR